ncbi:alcohol oxidase [Fistulina hepatica ATCC 64428]|uniref:Alcohol oxidase n=1 Tax=Fistulina hepatica ATCC 64428 TaxID=1128425 RepID=A0A0D7A7R2_9AGAR|nr:alcohol oxidase [Fistulina hepatica ATCC 64428]
MVRFLGTLNFLAALCCLTALVPLGGAGGSTVANRLSEDPSVSVLLLEAGGANDDDLDMYIPLLCTRLTPNTPFDWNYTTVPQTGLNNRSVSYPTGFGLGGSTSVNCLVYTRGSIADIDLWGQLTDDPTWSWDNLLPYYKKSERFNFPRDGHNVSGEFLPQVHGFDGVIGVSLPGSPRAIDGMVISTLEELPAEFPYNVDMNSGANLGVGWVQALVDGGVRSSAKQYLAKEYVSRENLDVLLHAKVSRVLPTNSDNEALAFRAVEFLEPGSGSLGNLTAAVEVILSAGSINTPNILLHSGIGDADLLESVGVPLAHNLTDVGKGLRDHVGVATVFLVNSTETFDTVIRNETLLDEWIAQWNESKTGLLVDTSENHVAWLRVPDNSTFYEEFPDPASSNKSAHMEILFQVTKNGLSSVTVEGNYMNVLTACVAPTSRGSISINSSDLFAPPLVDPGLLSTESDLFIVRESIRSLRRFLAAPAWDDYIITSTNDNATTDEEINEFIKENAVSFYHPVASAAMSPYNATHGVVNPDLRVKGVDGLRIIDASVAPSLPGAHTSATVYVIAERAADIIKAEYGYYGYYGLE